MLYNLSGVKRILGGRAILDINSLSIEKGKIYSLTGPNGAGKTTLLRLLAFLDRPDTGRLEMEGKEVRYLEKNLIFLRRRAVLIDQYPIMFSGTVLGNVEFGLKVRGISRKKRYRRSMEFLEMVGMHRFAASEASSLSGGETKRVALARAFVVEPEVLLCDEPTANVDQENQEIILNAIKTLNEERQTSILFATHYLSQAQRLAHRTLYLQHGFVAENPHDNGFRFQVIERTEQRMRLSFGDNVVLQLTIPGKLPGGSDAGRLFIDPEKVEIAGKESGQPNSICGRLEELSFLGEQVRRVVEIGDGLVVLLSKEQYGKLEPQLGQQLSLCLPEEAIRFSETTL